MVRFSLGLLLLIVIASCSRRVERADLVFINGAEPQTIDPALVTDQVGMRISSALFEGLCRIREDGKPEPGVAERWEVSADGLTYTFDLRDEANWSNGDPVTASDFIGSWKRVLDPTFGADYAAQLYVIAGARDFHQGRESDFSRVGLREIDPRTLEVRLENPTPFFIDLCAFATLAPVHLASVEKYGTAWIKPGNLIGNGPYVMEEWLLDDHIQLAINPHYWDETNVAMKTVKVLPISEPNTAINYFLTGQADLIMDKGMVPTSLTQKLKEQPYFHTGPFLGTYFTRFNVTQPPFDDPRVRLAFSLAVDRSRITEKITQLGEMSAASLTPPGTGQDYQPPPGPTFELERARQLLADAGYPDGKGFPRVEYLYFPKLVERNIAVELQSMWREGLGVTVDLVKQEWKIYLASLKELKYDLGRSSWVGDYNDPSTFLEMFLSGSGNNRTGWASQEFDDLIAQAAGETDVAKRNAIFQRAEKMLVTDDAVILPIYFYVGVQFYHPERLAGVQANLIDDHPFRCMRWK